MSGKLAILACAGALPVAIARANPDAMVITLEGIPSELEGQSHRHRLEKIGTLFAAMKDAGIGRMVFAGSLVRPALDPSAFDAEMAAIAPRLMAALQMGDDGLLRTVIAIFEEQGFSVVGAHQVLPALTADPGLHAGTAPDEATQADIARATEILRGLAPLDLGQACVVAGGQCLGIETVQGTDALLKFVAATPPEFRRDHPGVLVKAAKAGQDLRIDMPTIGPRTIDAVAVAGLAGLVIEAGKVMILDRDTTLQAARDKGIFLVATEL
ncbi:UDP-2,3-diacylglucosamine diphosphatase LpxI [Roseovarius sp.]|uniref:LpxI family protein n=1 Tax=Roseovarius sp. TaxID=1486281 RepID=UPI00260F4F8E|nr:UDP-2,3-diacylglucosamine diphosphatase LpxI [Roseovarius sp.]MDM8167827.1 UDP-2,3-diacylglucosamine diphosphatase LpxI [Roseovarius sp.]